MTAGRRIVCDLDPSTSAEERILDALAACEEQDAELYVVWVPGVGAFGVPAVVRTALDDAAARGIRATSAVRFGDREVVLRELDAPVIPRVRRSEVASMVGGTS
jgi:hypothetical protein